MSITDGPASIWLAGSIPVEKATPRKNQQIKERTAHCTPHFFGRNGSGLGGERSSALHQGFSNCGVPTMLCLHALCRTTQHLKNICAYTSYVTQIRPFSTPPPSVSHVLYGTSPFFFYKSSRSRNTPQQRDVICAQLLKVISVFGKVLANHLL